MSEASERLERICERATISALHDPEFQDGDRLQVFARCGTAEEHNRSGAGTAVGYGEDTAGTREAMLDLIAHVTQMGHTAGVAVGLVRPGDN